MPEAGFETLLDVAALSIVSTAENVECDKDCDCFDCVSNGSEDDDYRTRGRELNSRPYFYRFFVGVKFFFIFSDLASILIP